MSDNRGRGYSTALTDAAAVWLQKLRILDGDWLNERQ